MNAVLAGLLVMLLAGPIGDNARSTHASSAANPDLSGPNVVVLDQVPGCYGSVRFDHRLHVQMSSIQGGCTNCHHDASEGVEGPGAGTESGPVIRPCRTCHEPASVVVTADKPGLRGAYHRQCLSCHKDWAHENACGFCHTDSAAVRGSAARPRNLSTMLLPRSTAQSTYVYQTAHPPMPVVTFHHEDHAQRFGLKCVDCHGGSSCGQCHGSRAERPIVNRQQSCYQCHAESRCVTCHNRGERGPFDHAARTGWQLRPGHASLTCDSCHGAGQMPERPSSDACRTCHARRWGDEQFDHTRTGVELSGDHAYFECIDCHSGGDDRMLASCYSCHTDRPVAGHRWVGTASGPAPAAMPAGEAQPGPSIIQGASGSPQRP